MSVIMIYEEDDETQVRICLKVAISDLANLIMNVPSQVMAKKSLLCIHQNCTDLLCRVDFYQIYELLR